MKRILLLIFTLASLAAPVLAKSSSNSVAAVDQETLKAIATQLKAQSMAEVSTPATALVTVENELDKREEKTEQYSAAKAGFYSRLAGVLLGCVAFDVMGIDKPSDKAPALLFNCILLGAWAAYECSPLASRMFDYLMEAHQDQAA